MGCGRGEARRPCRGGTPMTRKCGSGGPAELIEAYLAVWLPGCEGGRRSIAALGFEGATNAMCDALQPGLIQPEGDAKGFTGITRVDPPSPPAKQFARPSSRGWSDA